MTDDRLEALAEAIREQLPPGHTANLEDARQIAAAAEPLWEALATRGMVDAFGGAECRRVLPAMVGFAYEMANRGPRFEPPPWLQDG